MLMHSSEQPQRVLILERRQIKRPTPSASKSETMTEKSTVFPYNTREDRLNAQVILHSFIGFQSILHAIKKPLILNLLRLQVMHATLPLATSIQPVALSLYSTNSLSSSTSTTTSGVQL